MDNERMEIAQAPPTQPEPAQPIFTKPVDPRLNVGAVTIESERAIAEVQAAVIMARKFPRDEYAAREKVLAACRRFEFAEKALYKFKRGGTPVQKPSIRLAEEFMRALGNMRAGIKELAVYKGESEMQADCWDLESNNYHYRFFRVPHEIYTKESGTRALTTSRDIRDNDFNIGARSVRECILHCVDYDLQTAAVKQCQATILAGVSTKSGLQEKMAELVIHLGKLGITVAHITQYLRHDIKDALPEEYTDLATIYVALRDGEAKASDYFVVPKGTTPSAAAEEMDAKLAGNAEPTKSNPPTDDDGLLVGGGE